MRQFIDAVDDDRRRYGAESAANYAKMWVRLEDERSQIINQMISSKRSVMTPEERATMAELEVRKEAIIRGVRRDEVEELFAEIVGADALENI